MTKENEIAILRGLNGGNKSNLPSVPTTTAVKTLADMVQDTIIDYSNYDDNAPIIDFSEPLLMIDRLPVMGGLVLVSANQKSGKSQFINICAIEGLKNDQNFNVWLIDTEQAKASIDMRYKIIRNAIGEDNARRLKVVNFKQFKETSQDLASESIDFLKEMSKSWDKNSIILIDGIRDMVKSINDETQADDLLTCLRCIADDKGCTFISVLHYNKRSDVERGFIGSEAINKVDQNIRVMNIDSDNVGISAKEHEKMQVLGFQFFAVCSSGAKDYGLPTSGDSRHNRGGAMAWNINTMNGAEYKATNHRTGEIVIKHVPMYDLAFLNTPESVKNAQMLLFESQRAEFETIYQTKTLPKTEKEGLSCKYKNNTIINNCGAYKWLIDQHNEAINQGLVSDVPMTPSEAYRIMNELVRLQLVEWNRKSNKIYQSITAENIINNA